MASEDAVMAVIRASRPLFRNPHDKIAFAVHGAFLASGYTLKATGSEAFSETALSSPPSDEVGIEGWNETGDSYGFVYTKDDKDSKITVLVKCLIMGDHLVIDALSSKHQNKEPTTLQIIVNDYDGGNDSKNFANQYKIFGMLVKTLNSGILHKIEESPEKGSVSTATPGPSSFGGAETSERSGPERNLHEPQSPQLYPPGYFPHPPGLLYPPVIPGHNDDLHPGLGAGIYPRRGPDIGGGSMLIGPHDPRWFGPMGEPPGFPGGPLGGVPPGSRFDPYGPPGVPGFEPNRFGRNQRRPGTHPDLEPFGNPDFI